MRKLMLLVLILVLLALGFASAALEDDDLNLCTDGTWDCDDPEDPGREVWNWLCGWYWANYNASLIDEVPDWCQPEIIEVTESLVAQAYCQVYSEYTDRTANGAGGDLVVEITGGDGPFTIMGTGTDLPMIGVDLGTYVLSGPGPWTGVTVTELGGDFESINLGDFNCNPT